MEGLIFYTWLLVFHVLVALCSAAPSAEGENIYRRLHNDLLLKYDDSEIHMRPVVDPSTPTTVFYRLLINKLIDLDIVNQLIQVSGLLKQTWRDEFLQWNYTEYGGIKRIHLPSDRIWLPDITLHRNVDDEFERIKDTRPTVAYDGTVTWYTPVIYTAFCRVDVLHFPFDTQACELRFTSWVYHGFEIDLQLENSTVTSSSSFSENGIWDLVDFHAERFVRTWACCPEPWPELDYTIVLHRRPEFYVSYLIIPCICISVLSVLVFLLPVESGDKLSLSITNLLGLVVFQQLIADTMPPSGAEDAPILAEYFLDMVIMVSLSVVATVLVIHISEKKDPVPRWVQVIFLRHLARVTFVYEAELDSNDDSGKPEKTKLVADIKDVFAQYGGNTSSLNSVADDLHFLRTALEENNAEELIVQKWKLMGKVIDRCLFCIFGLFVLIATVVLLYRAQIIEYQSVPNSVFTPE